MNLKFHNSYKLSNEAYPQISTVAVTHENKEIGYMAKNIDAFVFIPTSPATYTHEMIKAITRKLERLNKPAYKAPPTGFFKCLACGVEIAIKPIPYEEQAACPCHSCDGQVFCNEFKGWNHG